MLITGFNLSSTDYARTRRARLLLTGCCAVLCLALIGQLVAWGIVRRTDTGIVARLETMRTELRQHQQALQAVKARIPAEAVKRAETAIGAYNKILEGSAFSWIGLLVELERSMPAGVILSDIQPDPTTGAVAIRGWARNFEEVSKLLSALQEQPKFREVYLRRQSEKKAGIGGPGQMEFSLNLVYLGRPS